MTNLPKPAPDPHLTHLHTFLVLSHRDFPYATYCLAAKCISPRARQPPAAPDAQHLMYEDTPMDAANPWVGQSSTAPTPAATQPPRTLVRRRSEDEDDDSHVVKRIPVSNATRQEVEEVYLVSNVQCDPQLLSQARAKAIALESRLEYTENLVESMQVAWQQRVRFSWRCLRCCRI